MMDRDKNLMLYGSATAFLISHHSEGAVDQAVKALKAAVGKEEYGDEVKEIIKDLCNLCWLVGQVIQNESEKF